MNKVRTLTYHLGELINFSNIMPYCCVITCKNHSGKTNLANSGISYHRFPTDPAVKGKWVKATGRIDSTWSPKKSSTICSKHFDDNIIYLSGKSRRVPDDAVPTLNLPTAAENNDNINDHNESSLSDDDYPLKIFRKNSTKKLQAALDRANKLIRKQLLLIKRLREQNRRDSKKISLQNKVLNDIMEIYDLKNDDIAVLKAEILRSEEPDLP